MVSAKHIAAFQKKVLAYYTNHARDLPWRKRVTPYRVFVSEIMLQQTQASRVVSKFAEFMRAFPTVQRLAQASLREVLQVWSGLGYNRRAKFLHHAAQAIAKQKTFPTTVEAWQALPGVGYATAAAIMTYAYNAPLVYIETNIRSVFLHEFFQDATHVADNDLLPLVERCLRDQQPRAWYSALMDYGAHLKVTVGNPNARSKHHVVQSTFTGSNRQLRGNILKHLLQNSATLAALQKEFNDPRTDAVLQQLLNEGLIKQVNKRFFIG